MSAIALTFDSGRMLPLALAAQEYEGGEGIVAAIGTAGMLIVFAFSLLMIASMWKVFTKAGEPGWAAIVPIYNLIVLVKIAGKETWWVILLLVCFPIIQFPVYIALAERFGKGAGFGIGMALLPFVFFPMLGFGSAQYRGAPAA